MTWFVLIGSICLLLRWGAMDAEAYPEASRKVLQILWGISTSTFPDQEFQWETARISALEALAQYEVNLVILPYVLPLYSLPVLNNITLAEVDCNPMICKFVSYVLKS